MKTYATALLCMALLAPTYAGADPRELRWQIIDNLIAKGPFLKTWKLPSEFSVARLHHLITSFSEQVYGKGFRYLGNTNDVDHAHILFRLADEDTKNPRLESFAILYHTQENAYSAYWRQSVPPQYQYLDVRTRNWLQWLEQDPIEDGMLIKNAREYADPNKKDLSVFYEDSPPKEGEHYTIHSFNLSFEKLNSEIVGDLQFRFQDINCRGMKPVDEVNRRVRIKINSNYPDVCLQLKTDTTIIAKGRFY